MLPTVQHRQGDALRSQGHRPPLLGWAPCAAAGTRFPVSAGDSPEPCCPQDRRARAGSPQPAVEVGQSPLPRAYGAAGPPSPSHTSHALSRVRGAEDAGEISGARPGKREHWAPRRWETGAHRPSETQRDQHHRGRALEREQQHVKWWQEKRPQPGWGYQVTRNTHPCLGLGTLPHRCPALGALQSPKLTPRLAARPALPACTPKSGRAAGRGAERSPFLHLHLVSPLGFGWLGPALISATLEHTLVLKGVSFIPFPS